MRKSHHPIHRKRNGVSLVLIAIMLPIVIVLCGFAINLAQIQLVRTEMQAANDASARAAGRTFSSLNDRDAALTKANEIAALNAVGGQSLTYRDQDLELGVSTRADSSSTYDFSAGGSTHNAVRLHGHRTNDSPNGPVNYIFPVFGNSELEVSKTSISTQSEVDIVLVIDRSGSMAYASDEPAVFPPTPAAAPAGWDFDSPVPPNSRWLDVVDATDAFLAELDNSPQWEKVGLVTYSDDALEDVSLKWDYDQIRQGLDIYTNSLGGGGTNITSGLNAASATLANPSSGREFATKVIILMTDGKFNLGGNPKSSASSISDEGVMVFTVTFSDEADQPTMEDTADSGGGLHFHAQNRDDLIEVFQEIAKSLPTLLTQ